MKTIPKAQNDKSQSESKAAEKIYKTLELCFVIKREKLLRTTHNESDAALLLLHGKFHIRM